MSYLLDTNVVSEVRKGERADRRVLRWLSKTSERELYISVLVVGEIRQGIERLLLRDPEPAAVFEGWLTQLRGHYADRILKIDLADAERWGRMNAPDPLPAIDSLMAAQAKNRDMVLVSANTRDFERTGVALLNPFEEVAGG